jgi:hypothetical protein
MKHLFRVALLSVVCMIIPTAGQAFDQGVTIGYGLAAYNKHTHLGTIEGGRGYDFVQLTYLLERPCRDHLPLAVFVEPFAAYVARPNDGVDVGFYTGLKYYFLNTAKSGFFLTAGTGMAYTTTYFEEQGTHLNFTLEGGVGYRHAQFFIENRFRHYSNGATASPNRSVNANVLSVGFYF